MLAMKQNRRVGGGFVLLDEYICDECVNEIPCQDDSEYEQRCGVRYDVRGCVCANEDADNKHVRLE